VPVGVKIDLPTIDSLKYQQVELAKNTSDNDEWLTVKFRYKKPDESVSKLIEMSLREKLIEIEQTSENFRFSAAVAGFGMILRDSKYKGNFSYNNIIKMAKESAGEDKFGYRSEFLSMVEKNQLLAKN